MLARGTSTTSEADAREWLISQGIPAALSAALANILIRLWTEAWHEGSESAGKLTGPVYMSSQILADLLTSYASLWSAEIADTVLDRLAAVLAKGGDKASVTDGLTAVMKDEPAARRIVLTEATRAIAAAAYERYRASSTDQVRWVTEGPDPCPACIANERSGAHFLGSPFPSGDIAPPAHPNCRCALIPA